jgi:hypothetical protein
MHQPPEGDATPVQRFSDQLGRDYRPDPTGRHAYCPVHGRWSGGNGPGAPVRAIRVVQISTSRSPAAKVPIARPQRDRR